MEVIPLHQSCLLVTDVQRGFTVLCPDELPVPGGVEIVPAVNKLLELPWARIDASQDWHPPDHCSFFGRRENLYPPHCVIGTPGAEFLPGLRSDRFHAVWRKGYDRDYEAYAVTAQHPALPAFFKASGITTFVICGLALNICCFYSARDLKQAGFQVALVEDASAGIDVPAAGLFVEKAKAQCQRLDIHFLKTADVLARARFSH